MVPVSVNEPVSVELEKLQGLLFNVRLKLVVPRDPSAFTVSFVIKAKLLANVEFDSVADHVPLILPVEGELEPQPEKIRLSPNNITAAVFFMGVISSPWFDYGEASP
jgi:hypothetical protein